MKTSYMNKQKHLTLENRVTIETGLKEGKTFRMIAGELGKDPTTISKEIRKHRTIIDRNAFNDIKNQCVLFGKCRRKNVSDTASPSCIGRLCRNCPQCNRTCPDFTQRSYICPKTEHAPYVCNACKSKSGCRLQKAYYRAVTAEHEYRDTLVETRRGINMTEEDCIRLDEIVSPLIRQGQTPYMILNNHPEISICERTLYNYIDQGVLSVKNMDLPKKTVYKIRNVSSNDDKREKKDREIFIGRTYKDFQDVLEKDPDIRIVEMDTVVGCSGSHKVLLTLHFVPCEFMMAYILESKESKNVKTVFDSIEKTVGSDLFSHVFQLILTDRGGEFQRPEDIECDSDGVIRTSVYYCDPMCSWQKPHCEKNHEYIRKIRPEGSTFDDLSQKDVRLMMSHINSTPRESLGGMTPIRLAGLMLPKELLKHFGLKEIPADDVILTPKLLK